MIPIDDKTRTFLLEIIYAAIDIVNERDLDSLTDDRLIKLEGEINDLEIFHRRLSANELIIFDTRPRCMVNGDDGKQCGGEGRYQPFVMVHLPNNPQPIAQLATQPVIRVCEFHAVNNVERYLPTESWREIQAQVMRQSNQVVVYDDSRIMYLDHTTQTMIAAPTVTLVKV